MDEEETIQILLGFCGRNSNLSDYLIVRAKIEESEITVEEADKRAKWIVGVLDDRLEAIHRAK